MKPGYSWLFCDSGVIRWLAWRGSSNKVDLFVGNGFVAVNSELPDSFDTWRSENLP